MLAHNGQVKISNTSKQNLHLPVKYYFCIMGILIKGSFMTIGIYLLKFKNTDKVYIGQSINIEDRYTSHCTNLRCGNSSKKLQEAFNIYGLPELEILIECDKSELNDLENEAIIIYNSVSNGFNTMSSYGFSSELCGEECGNAKYTNEQIYEVFKYLIYCQDMTHKDIVSITGVSRGVVSDISSCKRYHWLKDTYPEEYSILEKLKLTRRKTRRTASSRNLEYPEILSPDGTIYKIDSIRGFAREHDLNPNALGRVLRKQSNSHKGWVLA